jgi:two-component system CheB/CheR fusion protein
VKKDTIKSNNSSPFAVVAVGASAGGLEAFSQLLRAIPNNTGMAFVFIQHLDPKHHSMLAELLAKTSDMPVLEAKNGTGIKANHVYVIPPNVNMGINGRRLQLTPRAPAPALHTPIDFFMGELAEDRDARSIGVVLSGTASDGTRGLAAIKAEGGITFAQDEKSAKYSGMPHSAVASGCVDFILPPEKIGRELARISGHPYLNGSRSVPATHAAKPERPDENFDRIFTLLRQAGGVNFSRYKSGTVQRRTLRRMAIHKIDHVSEYAKFLEKHPKETEELCQDLLIPVTSFFRDLEAFEGLKNKVFPAILKDKSSKGSIRIWAPGCSTGEETYSLAILLVEFLGDRTSSYQIQLFGTDANERGIEKARSGIYAERIAQEVSPERLRRFFTKVDEGYRVSKAVRDLCVFAKQNVVEDPPFSRMNMVACRNLLIYLGPELQRKVVPILHYALRPSGFLFLGNAESVAGFPDFFAPVDKKHKIFVKKAVVGRLHYDFAANRYPRETEPLDRPTEQAEASLGSDRQQEADHIVLRSYAPPGVVINENMEILQFRGAIGPYVEPAPGRASLHLLKIAKKEFAAELRAAVDQAKKSQARVKRKSVEFRRHGQSRAVSISVEPLGWSSENRQYLILFEQTSLSLPTSGKLTGKVRGGSRTATKEIGNLRRRLAEAEDHLRSLVESKEASDEEYQSANEEILSANEELQSTNEELETSKEELQSANEELNTVNDELHNRNIELDRLSSDLRNLLSSTSLPVVMVDRGLRIRRLTAASAKVLKIVASDVGRPIMDIRSDIDVPNLDELIVSVIETLTPKELEVPDERGHWYSLQIRPYRTTDDKIDGAVVVLSDIDEAKQASERIRKSQLFMEETLATVREPLVALREDLTVVYVNPSFLKTFKVRREDTEGKLLYSLGNEQWKIPKLRAMLEEVLSKDAPVVDFEVEHVFPELGRKIMLLNASKIENGHNEMPMMLLAIEDVTDRKRAERATVQSAAIVESSDDAMISKTLDGTITSWNRGAERLFGYTAEEAIGQNIMLIIPPDRRAEEETILAKLRREERVEHFDTVRVRKDGGMVDVSLTISPVKDATGHVSGVSKVARDITERRVAEKALQKAYERLETMVEERTASVRQLSLRLLSVQDEEHRSIARELHDSLGQDLAAMNMDLQQVRKTVSEGQAAELVSKLSKSLEKCMSETRTISYLLHPPLIDDLGFVAAAKWYAEGFSERSGIEVNLQISNSSRRMPRTAELPLFRILQATLSNVHRHAESPSVDIRFEVTARQAQLEVRDYGKGFDAEVLKRFEASGTGVGIGLGGMRERLRELGGRLQVESDATGTLIRAVVPISASVQVKKSGK